MTEFDPDVLSDNDRNVAFDLVGMRLHKPDIVLAPDGRPYLNRWHLAYDNAKGNQFFHIQVASDPERPLHDHPWENRSLILCGGYDELWDEHPWFGEEWNEEPANRLPKLLHVRAGDEVGRAATVAHRLILPADIPYTMTIFVTGPKVREWGFWYPDGWHHNKRHVDDRKDGVSYGKHDGG